MSMRTYQAVYLVEEAGISDKILYKSPSHAHFGASHSCYGTV
jgi:hypothetical protein